MKETKRLRRTPLRRLNRNLLTETKSLRRRIKIHSEGNYGRSFRNSGGRLTTIMKMRTKKKIKIIRKMVAWQEPSVDAGTNEHRKKRDSSPEDQFFMTLN